MMDIVQVADKVNLGHQIFSRRNLPEQTGNAVGLTNTRQQQGDISVAFTF